MLESNELLAAKGGQVTIKTNAAVPPSADRQAHAQRLSTGVIGLDEILYGGFVPLRNYLVHGGPGCGKTTLGMHFLQAGVAAGDRCLYITLGEGEAALRQNAATLGLSLDQIAFLDLSPTSEFFSQMESYDIFLPAEVEREPLTQQIIAQFELIKPNRVFLDAMTQFRFLATDAFQFRKQALSFLRFLVDGGATVLFTSESSAANLDDDLQFMSDGVLHLETTHERRTVVINKFRGSDFRSGRHDMRLTSTGMHVYPRLIPERYQSDFVDESISSGVAELDALLHGGVERGTISIVTGPSGVGKTTLGMQFMKEAAGRGERSVVYIFEEWKETLIHRCEATSIPVKAMMKRGTLDIVQVEPLHFTPGEFASLVRRDVEEHQTTIVMIDSVAGYRLSLCGEDLVSHLHALCKYLQNMGVAVLLINEVEAVTGDFKATEVGLSYLADNLIFLRYLELRGEICKAIGVLKKRLTMFEKTLREIDITPQGIKVGSPLTGLRGILTGHVVATKEDAAN